MSRCAPPAWLDTVLLSIFLILFVFSTTSTHASRVFPITTSLGINGGGDGGSYNGDGSANSYNSSSGGGGSSDKGNSHSEDGGEESVNATMSCADARMKCAYRTGCGMALQHYLTRCETVLGDINDCPEACQHALIGLMSTEQGKELTTCNCAKNDYLCKRSKQRAEVCRASVEATMSRPRVSCRVATWICNSDALCSTALQYYNENCKRMFKGQKCSKRCRNSINILRRQEKAAKLNTCLCDGTEEYDCLDIRRNMDVLCFNRPAQHHSYQEPAYGPNGANSGDTRTNRITNDKSIGASSIGASWTILLLSLVLLLHSEFVGAE